MTQAELIALQTAALKITNAAKILLPLDIGAIIIAVNADTGDLSVCAVAPRLKTTLLGLLADQFVKRDGPWRKVYDERKEYEKLRAPDMSKGHAHNRAKRYAVKQFVKWFWIEWMKLECPAKAEAS